MRINRLKGFFMLFMMSALLPIFCGRNACFSMDNVIDPCKSQTYLTIDSLYEYCKVPGPCGRKYKSEGNVALIKGFIDYSNIFDKSHFPNLPYQKFLLTNRESNKSLEVWVATERSKLIFEKIFTQKSVNPDGMVFIQGILIGFDMPMMGACHRGMKIEIIGENSVSFDVTGTESGK